MNKKKVLEYSQSIMEAIAGVLEEIGLDEFENPENLKDFVYAMCIVSPRLTLDDLTGVERSSTEFVHMINNLCYEHAVNSAKKG